MFKIFLLRGFCKDSIIHKKKERGIHMMKPVNRIFLILGAMSMFSLFQFDAMGSANDGSSDCSIAPAAGHYCKKKGSKPACPTGCYCPGGVKTAVGEKQSSGGDTLALKTWCNKHTKYMEDYLNKRGVYYCDAGKTSNEGASSKGDCFDENDVSDDTKAGCNSVGAGKYCLEKNEKKECPAGCYCDGMKNSPAVANILGLPSDMAVRYACAKQDPTLANQLSNAGVHYCGLEKTSPRGSDNASDCKSGKTAYDGSDNCTGTVNEGHYCKSKNNHNKCPEGCYCEGGENAVGDQWWNSSSKKWTGILVETWCNGHNRSYLTSYLNDRGIFYCPEAFPDSDKGAKKKGDCYFTVDGIKVYEKNKYAIDVGYYFPKGTITQQACECESGTQCYCPGKQSVSASNTQAVGREICPRTKVSNSNKTDCECPEGTEWVDDQDACVSQGNNGGGTQGGGTQGGDSNSCSPGQYWKITAEARVNTPAVRRVTAGAGSCTDCEAGYYCPDKEHKYPCTGDTYTDRPRQTQCLPCNGTVTYTGNLNTGCSTDPDNPGDTTYTVTYNCGDHGTGDLSNNGASHTSGTQVTTLASTACTRNEGYTFSNWECMAGNTPVSVDNAGQFTMPSSNVTCTAQWSTGGNGNGGGNGNENEDAVCPVGQYLPADGEDADDCEQCSGNYVCPGDDASYRCPWTVSGNTCGGILDAGQLKKGKSRNRDCWKFFNSPSDYRECVYGFSID